VYSPLLNRPCPRNSHDNLGAGQRAHERRVAMPPGTFIPKPHRSFRSSLSSTTSDGSGRLLVRKHSVIRQAGLSPIGPKLAERVRSRVWEPVPGGVFPVSLDRDGLVRLCETYRISELSLFGSVVRDDFDPRRSDVDVVVEFLPDTPVRGFGFFDELSIFTLQDALEEMFHRKVDLVRKEGIDRYIRDDVLSRRMVICKSSDDGGVQFMTKRGGPGASSQSGSSAVHGVAGTIDSEPSASSGNRGLLSDPSADRTPRGPGGTDAFVGIDRETASRGLRIIRFVSSRNWAPGSPISSKP